jgi:hypothetical protein
MSRDFAAPDKPEHRFGAIHRGDCVQNCGPRKIKKPA